MAKIPVYDREVAPQFNQLSYIDSRVNQDTFGGNIAQAQKNVADAMGYLGNEIIEIKDRVDKTKILELKNKSDEWSEQTLYSENGYLRKTGKDAYGQSENIMKDYDNYMSDELGKLKLSPANYQLAKTSLGEWRIPLNRTATLHDYKQGINWSQTEIEKSLNNSLLNAVNNRNNPEEMKKALATGFQVIDWGAAIQKSDEATTNYKKQIFSQQVYENVLSGLISDNSLNAVEFFEQNKNKFSPDKVVRLGDAVNTLKRSYYARETAKTLVNLPTEQAYENINAIQDIEDRNAVVREYSFLERQKKAIQKERNEQYADTIANGITDILNQGGNPNDLKNQIMRSDLPFESKKKYIDLVNDCVSLGQEASLWTEVETLNEMITTDFEKFQKEDLSKYALSKSEREKYKNLQNKVVNYSTESDLRKIVDNINTRFNWNNENLKESGYKDNLYYILARMEKLQGQAFDIKNLDKGEVAALIAGMNHKSDSMPQELHGLKINNFKNIDETKELIARSENLQKEIENYPNAKFKYSVNDAIARKLVRFRADNKREPDPSEIYSIAASTYADLARVNYKLKQERVNNQINLSKEINNKKIKKVGYTKALTYFEEDLIPLCEKETGVKIAITSTYRSNGKYGHQKGMKADIFPVNPTDENVRKVTEWLLKSPAISTIFTSSPTALNTFRGNSKLKSAVAYDNSPEAIKGKINHKTHLDITLSSQFGGTEQIKPSIMYSQK